MIDMHGSQDGTFNLLRLSMGGSKKPEGGKRGYVLHITLYGSQGLVVIERLLQCERWGKGNQECWRII
jgi:hypothetical protein